MKVIGPNREAAIDALAKALRDSMERGDPSDESEWSDLSEADREWYRTRIEHLLLEKDQIVRLLSTG